MLGEIKKKDNTLGANREGLYKVGRVLKFKTYILLHLERKKVKHLWNVIMLRAYYQEDHFNRQSPKGSVYLFSFIVFNLTFISCFVLQVIT